MIESAHSLSVPVGKAIDFFDRASAEARDLAVVSGELYFELHRGTYTSQAKTKNLNRLAQEALREAEMWAVAAGWYPRESLDRCWKRLLLHQFHDILPGSSIDWVYEEAERKLNAVCTDAQSIALAAMEMCGAEPLARPPVTSDGPLEKVSSSCLGKGICFGFRARCGGHPINDLAIISPARSTSASVVSWPNENRTAELACDSGKPIASRT